MTPSSSQSRARALSRILRVIGAAALIGSASVFLVQRWDAGADVQRYLMLLLHTALLAAAAFVCGLFSGDRKGARTLFAIVVGVVPIHFAVLGALVYSRLGWDETAMVVPAYASWMAPSAPAALATVGVAALVLVPLVWTSFLALARRRAGVLTLAYVAMNLAFLIPTRDPDVVAAMVACMAASVAVLEVRPLGRDPALRTLEGSFARGVLLVPLALLVGRSLLHYTLSSAFDAAVAGGVALFLFVLSGDGRFSHGARATLQHASLVPGIIACTFLTQSLIDNASLAAGGVIPTFVLLVAGLLAGASVVSVSGELYRRAAAVIAVAGMSTNLLLFPGVAASFVCLVTAIAVLAYGYLAERRLVFFAGTGATAFGLVYHLRYAAALYAVSRWGSLAALGIAVIFAAAYVERCHEELIARVTGFRRRLAAWEY